MKVINYLTKNADKLLHFIVCLIITIVVAQTDILGWHRGPLVAIAVGVLFALAVGIVKEILDFFFTSTFSVADLVADLLGAVIGGLLMLYVSI